MYTDYYQLSADPFRLTPDHRFVYPHESYSKVHASMRHALEQGEGILVVTGRPGTGKSTLVEYFLAGLGSDRVPTAKLVSTQLERDDLLRMVVHAFGLGGKYLNKARLLCRLESHLRKHPRALLVIDEAQNLPASSLEELRMLTNLQADSRPLLQVFLVGQEELRKRLRDPGLEQLQQRLTAVCELRPLDLENTLNYVLHRLGRAGWRGNPAIATDTFPLIHRCTRGLPRFICKQYSRLLLYCATQQRSTLELEDVATVAREMHDEFLLPLSVEGGGNGIDPLPDIESILRLRDVPARQRMSLSGEEEALLNTCPALLTRPPDTVGSISITDDTSVWATFTDTPGTFDFRRMVQGAREYFPHRARRQSVGYGAAALLLVAAYQLGSLYTPQRGMPESGPPAVIRDAVATEELQQPPLPLPLADYPMPGLFLDGALPDTVPEFQGWQTAGLLPALSGSQMQTGRDSSRELVLVVNRGAAQDPALSVERSADSAVATENSVVLADISAGDPNRDAPAVESVPTPEADRVQELLGLAGEAMARDRLMTPRDLSAWHYFQEVFLLDPGNPAATEGLRQITGRYAELATLVLERRQYDRARAFVDRGLRVSSSDQTLLALQRIIEDREAEEARLEALQLAESEPEPSGFFGKLKQFFAGK